MGEVLPRLQAQPGAEAAALTNVLPLDNTPDMRFSLDGDPNPPFDPEHLVATIGVSPEYFRAVGTPIIRGRGFNADDRATAPRVMVVNRDLADRFFAGAALGRRIYIRDPESERNSSRRRSSVW